MHESEAIDVSVILVTWNALDTTATALESLRRHTAGVNYEVFVVDNGTATDASATELPRRFPWIRLIANKTNMGFTKANNQGLREARGRYVLLLNNDTVQTQDAIGDSVRYLDAHPDVGVLGIMHQNNDPGHTFQSSAYRFPTPVRDILGVYGFAAPAEQYPAREMDVDWVCGSFLMMRRETLSQIGPLDERYFIYDEDIDWCLQARKAGWKVRYWPGVSMIHLGAAANPYMRDKTSVMFRSHLSYLRKNHGLLAASGYYGAMGSMLLLAGAKQVVLWPLGRATRADIRRRWQRLGNFLLLRPGNVGG